MNQKILNKQTNKQKKKKTRLFPRFQLIPILCLQVKGGCADFTMCIFPFQLIDLDLWNVFCEVSPWGNFLFTLQRQNKVCNPGDEAMM